MVEPYAETAKPYQEYLGAKVQSTMELVRPAAARAAAHPVVLKVYSLLQPLVGRVEEELQKMDASADAMLEEVSPEQVFEGMKQGAAAAAVFAAAHADDAKEIVKTVAEAINESRSSAPEGNIVH